MWRYKDTIVESVLSFYVYMDSGGWTQLLRFIPEYILVTEQPCWPYSCLLLLWTVSLAWPSLLPCPAPVFLRRPMTIGQPRVERI